MSGIKIVGLIVLSLLLFISLQVFGTALLIDRTALNADFVSSEIEKLDITAIVTESISEDSSDFDPELVAAVTSSVGAFEEQFDIALRDGIHDVFEYLRGKREQPELAATLRNSFLRPDFIEAVIDELDISGITRDVVEEELGNTIEAEAPKEMAPYILDTLIDFIDQHEVWLKQEMKKASGQLTDYLLSLRSDLQIQISIAPLLDDLEETLYNLYLEYPPEELHGMPPEMFRTEFAMWYDEAIAETSTTFAIDSSFIGNDVPQQISIAIGDAETALVEARQYIGYFQSAFIVAIIIIVLLIGAIVLVCRGVKCSTRTLGMVLGIYGLFALAGVIIAGAVFNSQVIPEFYETPASIQDWLPGFFNAVMAPLQWFSTGMLILGVALLVFSFVYPRVRPAA